MAGLLQLCMKTLYILIMTPNRVQDMPVTIYGGEVHFLLAHVILVRSEPTGSQRNLQEL